MSRNHTILLKQLEAASDNHLAPTDRFITRKKLKPLTAGQKRYIEAIEDSRVTFCTGPAGVGKSYIATAMAVGMLLDNKIKKILISRPAIEAGESLGFLPGELEDKFKPFTRPVLDAMVDFLTAKEIIHFVDNEIIEFCPLAYMRGRSLHDSIMILDEAQNAKESQLLNFITRIGQNSRMVINGDTTPAQCDLPPNESPAFRNMLCKFNSPPYVDGVQVVYLTEKDIVRDGDGIIGRMLAKLGKI